MASLINPLLDGRYALEVVISDRGVELDELGLLDQINYFEQCLENVVIGQ